MKRNCQLNKPILYEKYSSVNSPITFCSKSRKNNNFQFPTNLKVENHPVNRIIQ